MINASIVTYHTPEQQLQTIMDILHRSPAIHRVEVIDNAQGINRGYGAAHNMPTSDLNLKSSKKWSVLWTRILR